ncbi:MSHA biogenesis protein MshK [Vibrio sp. H11]|uniref:MSHA biogenesis protein MshK n=1 Tax=Vibrio sp. H11 TaxID=2565928 RepID=UPI001F110CCE|nr:MSHA biogenesis protein MshK [Vibrio sp. H11]
MVIRRLTIRVRQSYMLLGGALLGSTLAFASTDPTAPLGFTPAAKASAPAKTALPELHSILCSQTCNAIVNDQVVQSGDKVDGYLVAAVTESMVRLTRGGQHWELTLFSLDIKQ